MRAATVGDYRLWMCLFFTIVIVACLIDMAVRRHRQRRRQRTIRRLPHYITTTTGRRTR